MSEIAPDPSGWLTALRFDIGTDGGGAAWIEAELPAPNLVVINPRNGHAHLIYLLGGWVRTDFGDPSRPKVVRYAAAIERAYAAALGADTAYNGRFHHNPLSAAYVTKVGRDAPYSLAELAQYVDLATPATKPRPIGLGRNVEVFDRLRRWRTPRSRTGALARTTLGTGRWRVAPAGSRPTSAPKAARPAQAERDRSHRQERGALGLGALRRRGAAERPGSRRSASARSPPEGPGSRPGAFAHDAG